LKVLGHRTFCLLLARTAQAPTTTTAYGTAIHSALAWAVTNYPRGKLPTLKEITSYFENQLRGGWLREEEFALLLARGCEALPVWLRDVGRLLPEGAKYEYNFTNEGVQLGNARLSAKLTVWFLTIRTAQ